MTTQVSTGPTDGLFALIGHASRALEEKGEPLGVLAIELERTSEAEPELFVETTRHPQSRFSLARLDVRVRREQDTGLDTAVAERALREFGGTAYTNLCIAESPALERDPAARATSTEDAFSEAIDLTVYFPSRLPVWAKNLALVADSLSATALEACTEALAELGVGHRRRGQTLSVARWQLRRRPTPSEQNRALRAALRHGLYGAVYAATLPPRSSVRIEQHTAELPDVGTRHRIDVAVCRGISGAEPITTAGASEIETFVRREFGASFSEKRWSVTNTHGKARDDHRLGPIDRKTIQWSMNWGHRRV